MAKSFISVEADISEVEKALSGTKKSLKTIRRQTLGIMAKGTAKTIKSAIAQSMPQAKTLKKAYSYKVKKDGSSASVYPRNVGEAKNKNWVVGLSVVHNYGATVRAKERKGKNSGYLVFQTKDGWRKMKSVTLPARGFIEKGESYAQSASYTSDINAMIQKELAKYWG